MLQLHVCTPIGESKSHDQTQAVSVIACKQTDAASAGPVFKATTCVLNSLKAADTSGCHVYCTCTDTPLQMCMCCSSDEFTSKQHLRITDTGMRISVESYDRWNPL
ncbi:hypothetical protein FKM82_024119 [Ascaphus truei]